MNYVSIIELFYTFAGELLYRCPDSQPLRYRSRDGRRLWRNPCRCFVACGHICGLSIFFLVH